MNDYAQEKWNRISKVKDFLDLIEDPKVNVLDFMQTLVDKNKSGFWIAAKVNFDIDVDKIIKQEPELKHDQVTGVNRTASELEHHKKFNYKNGYDRHIPPNEIMRIADALGFKNKPSCYINNQLPGTLMHRHVDFVSCYTYEQTEDKDILQMEYDKERRQPKGQKDIWRCFVALDDWKPGQIVNFEPGFWTDWKKGDVLFFDWRNTPHSTANCGVHNRPLLKITGIVEDESYIIEARKNGTIKIIDV
jgi:hypothetical protein